MGKQSRHYKRKVSNSTTSSLGYTLLTIRVIKVNLVTEAQKKASRIERQKIASVNRYPDMQSS